MKKILNYFVILCGLVGLYFSGVGLLKFSDKRLLFVIVLSGSLLAIFVGAFDAFLHRTKIDNELVRIILAIFSGIILILGGLYILFFLNSSLFMNAIAIFAIVFFLIGVIKSISRLFKKI